MGGWQSIPLPKRMRALQRDKRGYPVPFIVLRDTDGRPHFAINDTERQQRCIHERRCPICGTRLDRELWFVGGPMSAFHERGAYLDSALHYECMEYAMRVCPYLAAPKYLGRIDTATIDPEKIPGDVQILMDPTMIPERPSPFVVVASLKQTVSASHIGTGAVRPERPYIAVEFWEHGERLEYVEGIRRAMERVNQIA